MDTTFMVMASLLLSSLVIAAMLMIVVLVGSGLKERVFRLFFVLLVTNLLLIGCEITSGLLSMSASPLARTSIRAVEFANGAVIGVGMAVFGQYLYAYLSLKTRVTKRYRDAINCLSAVMLLLAMIELSTDAFYWLDQANGYHSGPLAWVLYLPPTFAFGVAAVFILRYRKVLSSKELFTLLLYPVAPIVGYVIEMCFEGAWISASGGTLTLFLIYISIQMDLKRKLVAQEAELTDSRISIMLSQIQPHFLFNALSAIDNLFYTDAEDAHRAMYTFSNYLKGNMDSLSAKELIPFGQEFEHTRQYLSLEKLRYRHKLRIIYDVGTDEIMLPVLTLQPIVENAVRHGVMKRPDGGTVTIRAEDAGHCYRITVTDDGVGFDPDAPQPIDDPDTHTGIANVRDRLWAMCGGCLVIQSVPGVGTTATIEVPKG